MSNDGVHRTVTQKGGAVDEEDFSVAKNIQSVKLRSRATGILVAKSLNLSASLKRATALTGTQASAGTTDGDTTGTDTTGTDEPRP